MSLLAIKPLINARKVFIYIIIDIRQVVIYKCQMHIICITYGVVSGKDNLEVIDIN